jgi:BirA family biotin operon repressor/biotin-[acetyl-CoA-carboxylase] ligase
MGLVHAGMAQHGTAVFTHEQTKGKGQRNKQWLSEGGKNIALSLVVQPSSLQLNEAFLLSMSVAIGLSQFLNYYTNGEVTIKWPNDIYWRDRKAAGILIENIIQGGNWKYAVIGIGVNLNQTNFGDFKRAVSLKQITGKNYPVLVLARELLRFLEVSLSELIINKQKLIDNYHAHLYKWKEEVLLKRNGKVIKGRLEGVSKEGLLIVQHEKKESFKVGEVEWM